MAESGTLHLAFLDELRDAYDAEKQLLKALPKMAKKATSEDLAAAFEAHLEETHGHVDKLEQVFGALGEKVRGKHCDGIAGIIEEGQSVMEENFDAGTMDARGRTAHCKNDGEEEVSVESHSRVPEIGSRGVVLIQLLLPTTFPNETTSQDAATAIIPRRYDT